MKRCDNCLKHFLDYELHRYWEMWVCTDCLAALREAERINRREEDLQEDRRIRNGFYNRK